MRRIGKQHAEPTPLPNDFVWVKHYVDQQVSRFFKHHAKTYTERVKQVLDGTYDLKTFGEEFGPSRICRWINDKHAVGTDHPNPCKSQNINTSPTYEACVKTFKQNPHNHAVARQLYKSDSAEVEAVLKELGSAGLLTGLEKYAGKAHRKRSSIPKLLALNTGLISALSGISYQEAATDRQYWGRLTESAVGAHLVNDAKGKGIHVYYWLNRNREVDFILESGNTITAIEAKSGKKETTLQGMEEFCKTFDVKRQLLVGGQGIAIEEFLKSPVEKWVQ